MSEQEKAAEKATSKNADSAAPAPKDKEFSRRSLFGGALGAALLGGAAGTVVGGGTTYALNRERIITAEKQAEAEKTFGKQTISCHGKHQAGVTTAYTAHTRALSFKLKSGTQRADIKRMLRVITADIEALTAGRGALADSEPHLAQEPARLTVTVGFGEELVKRVNPQAVPEWLKPLETFNHDQLDAAYMGGDLLLLIAADDLITVAHAARMLTKSLRSFADIWWRQDGFRRSRGTENSGRTMRNLMGQVDGTNNPRPEDEDFDDLVWLGSEAGWLAGGTAQVFRRISMLMDTWDQVSREGRETTIGRKIDTGAPLTGTQEFDEPDFQARNALGLTVINPASHIARAHSQKASERIYRRALNYDDGNEQGLLFICYQRDPLTQFVPIQRRLDELDMLNEWVVATGSAVFAIVPGWQPGGMLGESLFAV